MGEIVSSHTAQLKNYQQQQKEIYTVTYVYGLSPITIKQTKKGEKTLLLPKIIFTFHHSFM